jgi:hypothetical protein
MTWRPNLDQLAEEIKHAPSIFNSQPWFFRVTDNDHIDMYIRDGINLYDGPGSGDDVDPRRRRLPRSEKDASRIDPLARGLDPPARRLDPLAREFVISCGAALYNLRLAIRVTGHDLAVRLPPHPMRDRTLLASVEIMTGRVRAPTIAEQELYEAIWRRHTNRWPHTIVPAPLPIIVAMENAALQEGASLRLLHPDQANRWLHLADQADSFFRNRENAGNLSDAARRYQTHQEYRSRWVNRQDGVPSTNFGPTPEDHVHPTREDFWLPREIRHFEQPQLMALSTDDDQILDWLRAGQALQHAILIGTRYSVSPPYGLAARYHAPYRYGLPGRHHLVRRWRRELAFDGLSVSLLTQPLEQYDIVRFNGPANANPEDAELRDAALRPRPLPWRFAELPQVVIRVGYAIRPAGVAPRQWDRKQIIVDDRPKPEP